MKAELDRNQIGQVPTVSTDEEWEREREHSREAALQQVGATLNVMRSTLVSIVEQLQRQIHEAMVLKGFWANKPPAELLPEKVALVHSELSELLEANREGVEHDDKVPEFTGEEAEAADTLIRLLDMAGGYNWRLGEALVEKMLFNLSRPYKHGKKY